MLCRKRESPRNAKPFQKLLRLTVPEREGNQQHHHDSNNILVTDELQCTLHLVVSR